MTNTLSLFRTTPRIVMGPDAVDTIGQEVRDLSATRALIVTDNGILEAGLINPVKKSLQKARVKYEIFSNVPSDPPYETVDACVEEMKDFNPSCLIGLGGGSAIDIAKTAAVMFKNPGSIADYFGVDLIKKPGLPAIILPTTAGTGSEVTPIAILSDEQDKLKKGIVSQHLFPRSAILDPVLTVGLPPSVTAATGMDALIHAIEAYSSVNASGMTDMLASRAMELLYHNIRTAYANGNNIEARSSMMEGSLLAGMAFANAGVTAVHAFAYPIGAEFHIPHGIANTLMLPHVMRFNLMGNLRKFADISQAFDMPVEGMNDLGAAEMGVEAIVRLAQDLHVPKHLSEFDIAEKDLPLLAQGVMKVTRLLANNPRTMTLKDAEEIYRAAL